MKDTTIVENDPTISKQAIQESEFYDQAILAEKIITEKVNEAIKSSKAHRRWFWELLQNARDTVVYETNRKVSVKLTYTKNDSDELILVFEHSGNPFKYNSDKTRFDDLKNLILPVSGKPPGKASGKFGTGFLSTHIISLKFKVNGVYLDENNTYWDFDIDIDRTETDREKRIESIVKSLADKKSSFKIIKDGYFPNKEEFRTTKFTYYLSKNEHGIEEGSKIVQEGLTDIIQVLPYVLMFIPEIDNVEIIDREISNTKIKFSKTKEEDIDKIKVTSISKTILSLNDELIIDENVLIASIKDQSVEIAIQIYNDNGDFKVCDINKKYHKETGKGFPTLFSSFPLIGSEDFKFPLVINSKEFKPNERRDGVELKTNIDGNQLLINNAIEIYQVFLEIVSKNWKDIFILAKTEDSIHNNHDWIDKKWYEEGNNEFQGVLKPIRKKILNTPIVDVLTKEGTIVRKTIKTINNTNQIFFPLKENKEKLYEFGREIFPNALPILSDIENWCSVIWNEKDFTRVNIELIIEGIANYKNVSTLSEHIYKNNTNIDETLDWLFNFYNFIKTDFKDKTDTLFNQLVKNVPHKFIPDRELNFWLLNDLKKDLGFKGIGIIDETLLTIHKEITLENFKAKLLNTKFTDFLQTKEFISEEQVAVIIREVIDDKLKKEDNLSIPFKNSLSQLYDWISVEENNNKECFKEAIKNRILSAIMPSEKVKYVTKILELDRNNLVSLERQVEILSDPELEEKLLIGNSVLKNQQKFREKALLGKVYENLFLSIMLQEDKYSTEKVEGEQDFIITNRSTGNKYFVEIKSVGISENNILMTERQVKKAKQFQANYFLCVIRTTENPTEEYFKKNAVFNGEIGKDIYSKVVKAEEFERPEQEVIIEFEDVLLRQFQMYRYKFSIGQQLWGQENFISFKLKIG